MMVKSTPVCNCIICSSGTTVPFQPEGSFPDDVAEVICKYLGWSTPKDEDDDYAVDGQNCDQFPFCQQCHVSALTLYKLDSQVKQLLEQINQLSMGMQIKILESFDLDKPLSSTNDDGGTQKITCTQEESKDEADFKVNVQEFVPSEICIASVTSERWNHFRRMTFSKFNPTVTIQRTERIYGSEAKRITRAKRKKLKLTKDGKRATRTSEKSRSFSPDILDAVYLKEEAGDLTDVQAFPLSVKDNLSDNDEEWVPLESPIQEDDEEEQGQRFDEEDHTSESLNKIPLEGLLTSAETDEIPEILVDRSHLFSSTKFKDRIKQVGESKFSYDDKRCFEFVVSKSMWHCLECESTSMHKESFLAHFNRFQRGPCFAKPSANMVEECKFKRLVYDKLKEGNFECRMCPVQTNTHQEMQNHLAERHTKQRKFSGTQVFQQVAPNKYFMPRYNVNMELLDDGNLKCVSCGRIFTSKLSALTHCKNKHNPRTSSTGGNGYVKKMGESKFVTESKFEFEVSSVDNNFHCCHCSYQCSAIRVMFRHIRIEHEKSADKICDICGKIFKKQQLLKHHLMRHEAAEDVNARKYSCDACGKKFITRDCLKKHENRIHPVSKDIMCDLCGSTFSCRSILNVHIKTHQRLPCNICGKIIGAASIRQHRQTHTTEKNYVCITCHKTFKTNFHLAAHRRHCGQKLYSCDVCGKKFSQSHCVRRHKKKAHDVENATTTITHSMNLEKESTLGLGLSLNMEASDPSDVFQEETLSDPACVLPISFDFV